MKLLRWEKLPSFIHPPLHSSSTSFILHFIHPPLHSSSTSFILHFIHPPLHSSSTTFILKLGWLPIKERRDFSILKHAFKAMSNPLWPEYLNLEINKPNRNLRFNIAPRLSVPLIQGTFQTSSATLFNSLPVNIRICDNYSQFCRCCKEYLREQCLALQ